MKGYAREIARYGCGGAHADSFYANPAVRVALFGPRGGYVGGVEVSPGEARRLAAELVRVADEAERINRDAL